ncbi:MAG: inositol monophosphatase [Clostridiales bacterium]|nr:inositol monophosphatase [Clostridiales bacterium]MCF8022426.1 inositol monophosphatase [Clostridiales bacterium]
MDYYNALKIAKQAALQAGDIIRANLGNIVHEFKSCPSDLVTEVDRKCENIIVNHLAEHFPEHHIVGEEGTEKEKILPGKEEFTWYVDPLDGTTNFVFGIPLCTVSIALTYGNQVAAGLVYDPLREETFHAVRGSGAFLNDCPIRTDSTRKKLSDSLLATGFAGNLEHRNYIHTVNMNGVIMECNNLRALGSAALELAWVACGRLTGFWEVALKPWDIAAGKIITEEAGGQTSDLQGNELQISNYISIASSNRLIHDELIDRLNSTD